MNDAPKLVSLSSIAGSRGSIAVPYTELEVNAILESIGDILQPALLDIEEESLASGDGPTASV
jgi:hypothetical protein